MSLSRAARLLRGAIVGGALVAAIVPAAAAGAAEPLACGAVVTTDVRLTHDLVDCPGDAIIAGADGITIDLGGHTVDGVGAGFGIRLGDFSGGHDDVTITNGTVREFANGIDLEVSHRTTVRGVHLADHTYSGVVAGYETSGVRIVRNTITGNGYAGVLVDHAADTTVSDNTIADNLRDGITVTLATRTTVTGNTVAGNGHNGIDLWQTDGDRLERNIVRHSGFDGITVDAAQNAVVAHNHVSGNGFDGITVDFGSDGTTVTGNRALRNDHAGFVVWGEGAWVARNTAIGNTEHGFIAYFADDGGSVDGGGNRAAGNGVDCDGFACR